MGSRVFGGNGDLVFSQYYGNNGHGGVDVCPSGGGTWDIVAHSAGTVENCVGYYHTGLGVSGSFSYGNYVKLRHAGGYKTLYAHMANITVSNGASVYKGQKIGYMGSTGNSTGPHLHFEVRDASDSRVNPQGYLNNDLPGSPGGGSSSGGSSGSSSSGNSGSSSSGGVAARPTTVEITNVKVVSVQGTEGKRDADLLQKTKKVKTGCEILVQNGDNIYIPLLIDKVTVEWSRKNTPGSLKFDCALDKVLNITEGNPVSFRYNSKNVFYGYIFEKSQSGRDKVSVTCYDQLRYFKNKTTLAYSGKTYGDLLKEFSKKYQLKCGIVEDTKYKLPKRLEDGSVFDILGNASDETVLKKGLLFVLYDDYGKLNLKKIDSMFVPIMIDDGSATGFKYSSTIDKGVYTKITLAQDNDQTGVREEYVANNTQGQKNWGVLEYYEAQNDMGKQEIKEAAKLLSKYYGKKQRSLSLNGCFGDIRVRGGSSLVVYLDLNDKKIRNVMVVEKVKHSFENGFHSMDLDLSGIKGEFTV